MCPGCLLVVGRVVNLTYISLPLEFSSAPNLSFISTEAVCSHSAPVPLSSDESGVLTPIIAFQFAQHCHGCHKPPLLRFFLLVLLGGSLCQSAFITVRTPEISQPPKTAGLSALAGLEAWNHCFWAHGEVAHYCREFKGAENL